MTQEMKEILENDKSYKNLRVLKVLCGMLECDVPLDHISKDHYNSITPIKTVVT